MRAWLEGRRQDYTHFITLSSNDPMRTTVRARVDLLEWDARMNREIVGGKWQKQLSHKRIVWFACLEGIGASRHWHLLFRLGWEITPSRLDYVDVEGLDNIADRVWRKLVPSGSTKTLLIEDHGARDYVTKRLDRLDHLSEFVDSFELKRS
ncbi:hypothetical protein [Aliiruegeria sabulilitoris]|uniref:hypothetical protein n=1 Tax=Aliiruegeria sabulilitoris TaxID=1510458 RepID=UPI000836C2C9|nr:hypothetical protein [Aliiruegeria sabulilitoris]NDR58328.1 hypothetical protein [Pseudoruegeria sp. M32A2M]